MDGVLPIDKPAGLTSHEVVLQVRRLLKIKKIGHTGTLDPYATGVLVLCIGKATRIVEFLVELTKEYRVTMKLGVTTDTQDLTGRVLCEKPVVVTEEELREQIQSFVGEIKQIPPMFSAIKIKGQRLYELARQDQEIERPPRKVIIYEIQILEIRFPFVSFQVTCSPGTYIRTLVSDLGERLKCGACVWELRRTRVGSFGLDEAVPFETLRSLSPERIAERYLISIDKALATLPALYFDEKTSRLLARGAFVKLDRSKGSLNLLPSLSLQSQQDSYPSPGYYRGYEARGNFFAVVKLVPNPEGDWMVQPVKVIYPL
ncbi:MAG TPA: tRNA pseudouridine(55) synthase TruB [Candidatus Limnocylindrales bacterium]|nr:tRNA pseudouridine(55) synthase TruB [Candidatus Limnocylindrales bacterium]